MISPARLFALSCLVAGAWPGFAWAAATKPAAMSGALKPNIVLIFVDDLGYGDIGPFGSTKNRTPRLDRMATEGMKLTSFYAAPVCSVSRAQLMTGCYGVRISVPGVYGPGNANGLNPKEFTIAERLKERGYTSICIGKWHLGDQPEFLPTRQGFDRYFGIPYSNDMQRVSVSTRQPVVPLLRDEKVIELLTEDAQSEITERYTTEAVKFIRDNRDRPFFLYLPHTAVHTPIHPGAAFRGKSANGRFGDWVEEVDASTGRILDTLRELELDQRTIVIFTTDNGPWLVKGSDGGIAGPLRGGKGSTWEGGVRVPTLARWPGKIAPGAVCDAVAGTIDLLPTFVALAGGKVPATPVIDGRDLSAVLFGRTKESPREVHFYFAGYDLQAVRQGPWKLALEPQRESMGKNDIPGDATRAGLRLYNLDREIGERTNLASQHPDIVRRLQALARAKKAEIGGASAPARRPAGVASAPRTLYPSEARKSSKRAALPANTTTKPNFIVVFSDDHTYRAVGYRNAQVKTPNLDRLAAEGLRLDHMVVASPICAASRASILTGVFPQQHSTVGLYSEGFRKRVMAEKKFATLPELLTAAGYHTALYGKSSFKDPRAFGFAEGRETNDNHRNDEEIFAEAEKFLQREAKSGRPFLLWLTPRNPHVPFNTPSRFLDLYQKTEITLDPNFRETPPMQSFFNQGAAGEIRFRDSALKPHSGGPPRTAAQMKEIVKAYYADISCLDEQVGQLIAHLKTSGLYDNTVVIYLSDNGYHLGNHGLGNKITMHEESVRVPAFVHSPLLPVKGAKSDALVSSLDIFPTLLEWAGIPVPTQLMGRSLRPILRDPTSTVRDHVISECVGPPDTRVGTGHRMVRTERYKYMLSSSDEEAFFDLREDPFELVDRLADAGLHTEIERHRRLLRSWMTAVGEKRLPPIPPVTPPRRPTKSQTPTGD